MAYPPDLLGPNEKIVLDLRPHWWFLVPRIGLLLLVVAVGTMVWVNIEQSAIEGLMGVGVLVALGFFGIRYARWATTSFVVTTDRVLFRQGLLTKTGIEIPLERINTVVFNQRFFERLIGAGDLEIQSAGETPSMFSDIRKPTVVQAEIYRQMEANENRKFDRIGSSAGGSSLSVAEQLEKLDDLRERGVLDDDEFQAQKDSLLGK